jgi:heme oxygenase
MLRNSDKMNKVLFMATFHAQIKDRTDQAHQAAEEAPFIASLMGGSLTPAAYLDYLKALAPIYLRMEELLHRHASLSPLSYFDHRALDRAAHIEADINYLEKHLTDRHQFQPLLSTERYLGLLSDNISPARLSAHHYIRYLGDLSGGQAIARLVSRHYLIPKEALNFYNFDTIGDVVFYKKRYRDFLNLIPFTEIEIKEFLDEVETLYSLSRDIFLELGRLHNSEIIVS